MSSTEWELSEHSTASNWSNLWLNQPSHNNIDLKTSIIPGALKVWDDNADNAERFDWNHPSDLPEPVLKWLEGSKYAIFNSEPIPDSDEAIIQVIHNLAGKVNSAEKPSLAQSLRVLIVKQANLVALIGRTKYNQHVHCGVGQKLIVACQTCGLQSQDDNPVWIVTMPGHYLNRQRPCNSNICGGKHPAREPVAWYILRSY